MLVLGMDDYWALADSASMSTTSDVLRNRCRKGFSP